MANSMALIASEVLPVPVASRNFAAMMLAFQLTPVTPTPLLPRPAIVPAPGWRGRKGARGRHMERRRSHRAPAANRLVLVGVELPLQIESFCGRRVSNEFDEHLAGDGFMPANHHRPARTASLGV